MEVLETVEILYLVLSFAPVAKIGYLIVVVNIDSFGKHLECTKFRQFPIFLLEILAIERYEINIQSIKVGESFTKLPIIELSLVQHVAICKMLVVYYEEINFELLRALQLSPQETIASPLYFEIAKWAAGTGCSVELPIPMGRPCIKIY
ncbi:MAG: hypothetical protein EZS28_039145 [Streblomastix strix]|uniref:Uncharacterized protein n=1 Tax=Streblomastix strix TaxID=222440 RepID=A0A5J4U4Q1_9EUKA|nr:MAG: hypothetical protein EZS28_039145 [Streblomastix strix]